MAGVTTTALATYLNVMYGPGVSDQFRRDAILPNLIPTYFSGNGSATWRAKIAARNTAAAKAQGADASGSDYSTDVKLPASIAWAHYEAFASITGTAQRIAAANAGYNQELGGGSEFDREIRDAAEELTVLLSTHTYSGTVASSPPQLEGLATAVDATGTYAGIAQGTYADWASGDNTHALASLTIDAIRTKLFRPIKDATGKRPSVVLCSGTIMDALKSLSDSNVTVMNTPYMGQVNIASLGFDGVVIDSVPFLEDRHATASTMYAVDLNELEYQQVPPDWLALDPGHIRAMLIEMSGKSVPVDEIVKMIQGIRTGKRMVAQMNALAKTGDSTKVQLVLDAQLCLRKRHSAAKLTLT